MKIIDNIKLSFNKIDKNESIVFMLPIIFFLFISFMVVLADPYVIDTTDVTGS